MVSLALVADGLWGVLRGRRHGHARVSPRIARGALLRVPYGHLLSAVGRADLNTYVNGVVLAMTIPLCWWAIPVWGIVGAAGVMATMLWVSGGLYVMVFELHLRRQSQV